MNPRTIFTILLTSVITVSLVAVGPAAAREVGARLGISTVTSTTTVPVQVRLASSSGVPINGLKTMTFKIYTVASGGSALWTEAWTAGNAVQVTDGVASVLLGSQTALPQSVVANNSTLYLGITIDVEAEMQPRVQLGSAPIAMTVPDGAISPRKASAFTYHQYTNTEISKSIMDTWSDFTPLSITVSALDVPVDTEALVLFDTRCIASASNMVIAFSVVVDSVAVHYTDSYPAANQALVMSFSRLVKLEGGASHGFRITWATGNVSGISPGTARCYDRGLSVILLGQSRP